MRFRDFDEFSASNGVFETEFVQFRSDPIESHMMRVSLDRLVLVRGCENVPLATRVSGPSDACVLALQLKAAGETFWRGREVNERTLFSYRPGAEHVARTNGGMVWSALVCEPAVLDETIRRMHGTDPATAPELATAVESDPATIAALRVALQQAFLIAEAAPHVLESHAARRSLEESILAAAIGALDPQGDRPVLDGPPLSHERVVRRAGDAITEKLDAPIYVADLCEAAGVSERTLRNAFQSVYGMSPIRFLQLRRLHQVRRALRRDAAGSVTEVALRHGFVNLGRFAAEYRQLFGESPSLTRRNAGFR